MRYPSGQGSRPVVPAQLEGGVSCPGGSNPNDALVEGSRVVPAAYSARGSLEGLAVVLASRGSARFLSRGACVPPRLRGTGAG